MNNVIKHIHQRAASLQKHVVFPEGDDPRVQKAAKYLINKNICVVTLLHSGSLSSTEGFQTLNYVDDPPNVEAFTQALWKRQQHTLGNLDEAKRLLQKPLYYAASMVSEGLADAGVAGATTSTPDVIQCALKTIGIKGSRDIVSSIFLISLPSQNIFTYADCGVVPYPSEKQLADIALESAQTHARLTETEPKVAMLSFSTKGSAQHERVQLVRDALKIVKQINPELIVDGELQFDAAFVPEIAEQKGANLRFKGPANVFIFPNLDAGNIAYKITAQLAGADATGPILQGLKRPFMDLSRACGYRDIINSACVAILMDSG